MSPSATSRESPCPRCGTWCGMVEEAGVCPGCVARAALEAAGPGWPEEAGQGGAGEEPARLPEVPGWVLTGVLGAGGMGQVYAARAEQGDAVCAVKVLNARWSRDPVMAARFETEAEALRRLNHPHIVRVLEQTETVDGRLGLAMEWVDGCDLGRLLRGERLSSTRALDIADKICQAVDYAHAQGVVHRDIKPSNILVGRDGTVKLADFGLAKMMSGESGASAPAGLTATTDQFGTAYYLAPERMQPGAVSGPPADLYALGVLLYHCLAGRMPLGNYTPLSRLSGLPSRIDGVVARALAADPAARFPSAGALRQELAAVVRLHLVRSGRRKWHRRLTAAAAAAALISIAVAAGAWWEKRKGAALTPLPPPPDAAAPPSAPWENSLGMKFVRVPGTSVLFSIWETRRRDFEVYRMADRAAIDIAWRADAAERAQRRSGAIIRVDDEGQFLPTGTWEDPGFPVSPDHAAGGIGIRDAQRFCLWLTWREQGEGRLRPGQRYRLPTTAEWLTACGGEDAPLRPGNLAGTEVRGASWPDNWETFADPDPFPGLAPVASFPAEQHGLFDLSGNVSEWVQDEAENTAGRDRLSRAKLRGPSARDGSPERASFAFLRPAYYGNRLPFAGFRPVLELKEAPGDVPSEG